jgi:hypothetical protein
VLVLAAPAALAYRPFDSTDAAVAERGDIEIELGPLQYRRVSHDRSVVAPALVVNWGFADRFEAVVEARQSYATETTGPGYRVYDAGAFVKTVLRRGSLQEGAGPSVACEAGVLLPDVNGESGAGASALVIVSQRWRALALHGNAGASWTRTHQPGFFTGVVAEGPDAWTVRPVGELVFEGSRGARPTSAVLAGGIWRASPALAVDAAFRLSREEGAGGTELRLGLTWAFSP